MAAPPPPTLAVATPTLAPEMLERPAFLYWPLPAYVGLARISQYPNSAWSWRYLGLNPGYACPPMFGYLVNVDTWPYWRDTSIPEAQDKAQADPHNFEMVECYSENGSAGSGHEATDIKAEPGAPVYAAADGLVQFWRDSGTNSVIVLKHCLFGSWDAGLQCVGGRQWYTTYMHIVPQPALSQANSVVQRGAQIGVIYDQAINSHLHFEVGHERRSYSNFVNPWGQDTAPWLGCLWQDQALCPTPDPAFERLAGYAGEELQVVQGDGSRLLIQHAQAVQQVQLWDNRAAVLDAQGRLLLREGRFSGIQPTQELTSWTSLAEGVLDFQITAKRIAILNRERQLLVLEGDPGAAWTPVAEDVQAFSLAATRLGYLTRQGDVYIQAGPLTSSWQTIKSKALAFQLTDNRIAYLDSQRRLHVNEGDLSAEYHLMGENVHAFQVTNLRLAGLDAAGKLWVKQGNLRAAWVLQAEKVSSFQIAGMRILIESPAGQWQLKTGDLYQDWQTALPVTGTKVWLHGGLPVYLP